MIILAIIMLLLGICLLAFNIKLINSDRPLDVTTISIFLIGVLLTVTGFILTYMWF